MIPFITKYIKDCREISGKRRLMENFLSLSVLQTANYILPLVTIPYLVRVLGPEKFGLIAFAQALVSYFVILTDYGFNLSATKKISICRQDRKKISAIFSAIMLIKCSFMLISLLVLTVMVLMIPKFHDNWCIYLFTFGLVAGNVLFPVWLFQGMEKMKYITLLNILAKSIFTAAIFIFIRQKANYLYVPLINATGFIIAGLFSLRIAQKDFNIKFSIPPFSDIWEELKDGWQIFVSSIAISLYTVSTSFILGIFTNNTIVGYYSAGERIIIAVINLMMPFNQTVFPRMSDLASQSRESALRFIRQLGSIAAAFVLLACLTIFIFAEKITTIILGNQYYESIMVIRILSFYPLAVFLNNIFANHIMIPFNILSERTKVFVFAGILNIILLIILIPSLKHIAAAISLMTTEATVTAGLLFYLIRHKFALVSGSTELAEVHPCSRIPPQIATNQTK
jgi:polysaccharide transporter, PST family